MCVIAPAELENRIVHALPENGRAQAFEVFQRLGEDGTCLKHFCDAVRSLLDQGRLCPEGSLGAAAPGELLEIQLRSAGAPSKSVAPGFVYYPDRPLGRGNAAAVYRGEDTRAKRPLAVKLLEIQGCPSAELRAWYLERFRQEPCLMARLSHPHVVEVVAWGETDEVPWYAMELLEGGTLMDRIRRERRLPPKEIRSCFRGVASALAAAARLGISHRDVKPGNIFNAGFKLSDFGMAKVGLGGAPTAGPGRSITSSGARIGTPPYVSPERAAYGAGDARSDLYSLAATMHHAATGRLLFPLAPDDGRAWAEHQIHRMPEAVVDRVSGFPRDLSDLIQRCLAKSPEAPFPDFDALVEALDA